MNEEAYDPEYESGPPPDAELAARLAEAWERKRAGFTVAADIPPAPPVDRSARRREPIPQKSPKGSARDRWHKLNTFVDCTLKDLTDAERAVWLVLFRDTKSNGMARTGQADMARRIGMSESTVWRALRSLRKRGLVSVRCQGGLGGRVSIYRVFSQPESYRTC